VHAGFQIMVALGAAMAVVSAWCAWAWRSTGDVASNKPLLRALATITPFGYLATEAGWTVTEVGRQPWAVQGLIRTADAVTPMPGLVVPFVLFTVLYLGLGGTVAVLVGAMVRDTKSASA
jgi:cytochrome d ubiquinol oxidase subunit I